MPRPGGKTDMTRGTVMFRLFGRGKRKYQVSFDSRVFHAEKTSYIAGETVRVTFGPIATDTGYDFFTDVQGVDISLGFDRKEGYILTFPMPAQDVKLSFRSHNTMAVKQ